MSAVVLTSENAPAFYERKLGLVPEPAAAVKDAEVVVESAKPNDDEASANAEQQTDPEKKQRLNLRFSELTEKAKAAEADALKAKEEAQAARERAEAAERHAAELQSKYEPPKADPLGPKPQRTQFSSDDEWEIALGEWTEDKVVREREVKDAQARIVKSWNERQAAAKAELPDYEAKIAASATLMVSDDVRDAILESDVGPKILYHLAENPALVAELAKMKSQQALRKIGNLEAKFEKSASPEPSKEAAKTAAAATEVSRAPAPISRLQPSNTAPEPLVDDKGEYHGTAKQWREGRKAGRIK